MSLEFNGFICDAMILSCARFLAGVEGFLIDKINLPIAHSLIF